MAATACEDRFNASSPATFFQLAVKDVPAMFRQSQTMYETLNHELPRKKRYLWQQVWKKRGTLTTFFYAAVSKKKRPENTSYDRQLAARRQL
jgi:hypothetical protein